MLFYSINVAVSNGFSLYARLGEDVMQCSGFTKSRTNIPLDSTCYRRWQISLLPGQISIFVFLQMPSSFDFRIRHIFWSNLQIVHGQLVADFEKWHVSRSSSVPRELFEASFVIFFLHAYSGVLTQVSITLPAVVQLPLNRFVVSAVQWFARHLLNHFCSGDRALSLARSEVSNKIPQALFPSTFRHRSRARPTLWTRGQLASM